MRQEKNFILILMALLSCMGLCACSIGRKPFAITVVNRTTYPLEDIRIRETDGKDWGENRLETTLAEGESAKIDLGKYTAAELGRGFQVQFYGEDERPINPNYDPDTATILENGSFLIFTPPDVSVPMFVDSAYDAVVYDKKIVELYALDDDGRGDLIPSERIPVLMGGALPFTNMQNLRTENNEDGTYRYEDFTQDGQILVVNMAEPTCFVPEVQDLEDYLTACAFALSDSDTYELLSAEENEEYTENLTYPVYIVTYTAGENEDTRKWTVFAMDTDSYTYLYGFCEAVDTEEDMDEIYQSIFSQLYLSDEN